MQRGIGDTGGAPTDVIDHECTERPAHGAGEAAAVKRDKQNNDVVHLQRRIMSLCQVVHALFLDRDDPDAPARPTEVRPARRHPGARSGAQPHEQHAGADRSGLERQPGRREQRPPLPDHVRGSRRRDRAALRQRPDRHRLRHVAHPQRPDHRQRKRLFDGRNRPHARLAEYPGAGHVHPPAAAHQLRRRYQADLPLRAGQPHRRPVCAELRVRPDRRVRLRPESDLRPRQASVRRRRPNERRHRRPRRRHTSRLARRHDRLHELAADPAPRQPDARSPAAPRRWQLRAGNLAPRTGLESRRLQRARPARAPRTGASEHQ